MKNQFTSRIVKFTFAFMFVLIASSCNEDNDAMDAAALAKDQINSEIAAKGGKVSTQNLNYGTLTYSSNGDICLGDPVTITFNNDQGLNDGLFKMSIWGPNDTDWVNLKDYFSAPDGGKVSYTFTPEDLGGYRFRGDYQVKGGPTTGTNTGWVEISPLFSVVNCDGCDESFSYLENEDGSYTFTYLSEVSLTDANVKFTCPHIKGFTVEDGKTYTENPANPNSQGSPTVLTLTGDIAACTPITFILSFDPDCEQNANGKLNLWTDFKVNEVSKKGSLESIKYNCE